MIESIITISVIGFIVGFLFSVPVAGPVSILITSHALKGERHFALATAAGAAAMDMIFCFIAVYGFTNLYYLYDPIIPYVLLGGALFLFIVGQRIRRTYINLENIDEKNSTIKKHPKLRKRSRFITGFMINLLNPSLFIGWLTTSFLVLSFAASLGFNVGGLDHSVSNNVETISHENGLNITNLDSAQLNYSIESKPEFGKPQKPSTSFQLLYSFAYALFVGIGSVIWFFYMTRFLVKHRHKVRTDIINKLIHGLGFGVWIFAVYLIYRGLNILLS